MEFEKEKNLRTIWTELAQDYPELFNLCSAQSLWIAAEKREMDRLLTEAEEKMLTYLVSRADIAQAILWKKRPDGIAIKMPTKDKQGEFVILEFKRMSDVTENYLSWARDKTEGQYASLKSALERTLGPPGRP